MKTKIILTLIIATLVGASYWHYDVNMYSVPETIVVTDWAKTHVQKQLSVLKKPITENDVKQAYAHLKKNMPSNDVVHFSVRQKKVTNESDPGIRKITYFKVIAYVLKKLALQGKLKDCDFLILLKDRTESLILPPELSHVPIFVFAKDAANDKNVIRLLTVDAFTLKSWPEIYKNIQKAHKKNPWQKKETKLYWRGKTTDAPDVTELRMNSPRIRLAQLTRKLPERYDARLTKILSSNAEQISHIKKVCGDIVPFASIADHLPFKYQITLDGLTATFPGYLWRMGSGCVNIKQDSTDVQWFYELFQPNVHYLPVARTLENVDQVLSAAMTRDAEMAEMAARARAVVDAELTPPKVFGYFVELINGYSALCSNT